MAKNNETIATLYRKYNLDKTDVFQHRLGYVIITRTGIEKIQISLGLQVNFDIKSLSDDHKFVVVKAVGTLGETFIETYGEASPNNNKMGYPVAMAEKRALSRVTLKAAGLYAEGIYGEDEADNFSNREGSQVVEVSEEPKASEASEESYDLDNIIQGAKHKLAEGLSNPVQVKAWFEKEKSKMNPSQRAEMEGVLSNY